MLTAYTDDITLTVHHWVESILSLPSGILRHTSLSPMIITLNKNKIVPGEIKFIDASGMGEQRKKNVYFRPETIHFIAELTQGKHPDHPLYKSVLLPDVIKDGGILSVSRYIVQESIWIPPNLEQEMKKLKKCMTDFDTAQEKLSQLLTIE